MVSVGSVISYPIPVYQNLPIEPQFYQPSRFVISDVTLGATTTITTTTDVNYVIGQLVRLLIPASFGCYQLNNQQGYVLSLPATNQVELSINSSVNVNAYIAATVPTPAQIIAIGDIGNGRINATGRVQSATNIPGSFINISPQ
jgi:hypothetical protein